MGLQEELSKFDQAASLMGGRASTVREPRNRYIIVYLSEDNRHTYQVYPGGMKIYNDDPILQNSLVHDRNSSQLSLEAHVKRNFVGTVNDVNDLTPGQCLCMAYEQVSEREFLPVMDGQGYFHIAECIGQAPVLSFKPEYVRLIMALIHIIEETDPDVDAGGTSIFREQYDGILVVLEEKNYRPMVIRLINPVTKRIILEVNVENKQHYILNEYTEFSGALIYDEYVDFDDRITEDIVHEWLKFIATGLGLGTETISMEPVRKQNTAETRPPTVSPGSTTTSYQSDALFNSNVDVITDIVKSAFMTQNNPTVDSFIKALRVALCQYGTPNATMKDVIDNYRRSLSNPRSLPGSVIE